MFVSLVLFPSSTNRRLYSFATYVYCSGVCPLNFFIVTAIHDISKQIKQCTCIGKIFGLWHLAIATTSNV